MTDLNTHLAAVSTLEQAGIAPPGPWRELADRYRNFLGLDDRHEATEQLAAAVVGGGAVNLPQLYGSALAEWFPRTTADVRQVVGAAVHAELEKLYQPHDLANYRQIRGEFDSTAHLLTEAAKLVDPELGSDSVVGASAKVRAAWVDAQGFARRLDQVADHLACAAVLLGAPAGLLSLGPEAAEWILPLVVDDQGLHRRRVWAAWEASGRTGRWGPLIALGAKIRSHPRPAELEPYRRPQPISTEFVIGAAGGHEPRRYDPEDRVAAEGLVVGAGPAEWGVA